METKKGISGFGLKMIAVITMLIDHTAASVLQRMLLQRPQWGPIGSDNFESWYTLYVGLRCVGRMAFPIYCFLLVEGFTYTKSRARYALRLLLFALISEIPFDLALKGTVLEFQYNNVFFTLLVGLLVIMATDAILQKTKKPDKEMTVSLKILRVLLVAGVLLAGYVAAELVLRCDYGAAGVLAVFLIYMLKDNRCAGFAFAVLALALLTSTDELCALLMLLPVYFYNGTRGRQAKYVFYAFYPAHLLILGIICLGLGL